SLSEPLLGVGIVGTQWRAEQLDGGEAAEVDVLGEVDGPHATRSETAHHPVPPGEQLADPIRRRAWPNAVLVPAPFRLQDDVAHRALMVQAHGPLLFRPTRVPLASCPGRSTPPWHRT